MTRINDIFADLARHERKALMPFVCGGHPGPSSLRDTLPAIDTAGASVIEVGFPFSDPIADGPVIAAAMDKALRAGVNTKSIFEDVSAVRDQVQAGLVAMVSVSIVHGLGGGAAFTGLAKDAGFDGFIFPDAPLEEAGDLTAAATEAGLTASLLVAPTTPEARAAEIAKASSGFVYLVARAGVTGAKEAAPKIEPAVAALRPHTKLPIACGFGVSTGDHVAEVVKHADAAIVGSALVKKLDDAGPDRAAAEAEAFVTELAVGLITQPA